MQLAIVSGLSSRARSWAEQLARMALGTQVTSLYQHDQAHNLMLAAGPVSKEPCNGTKPLTVSDITNVVIPLLACHTLDKNCRENVPLPDKDKSHKSASW